MRLSGYAEDEFRLQAVLNSTGQVESVRVTDVTTPDNTASLSRECIIALKWPLQQLFTSRREDVTAVCYQVWLLLISTVALMTESIPHIGASLVVHVIALMWSIYQIYATVTFKKDYYSLIVGPQGACGNTDLIQDYFSNRNAYVIGACTINGVSLLASMYLTWRLFEVYGWATFKKMGASRSISRAYKVALVISVAIQLVCFFYTASTGIWLDMIFKEFIGARPDKKIAYIVVYILTSILVVPWLYLAWYGIRRESKRLMRSFFVMALVYLGGSFAMFKSDTFRQTFRHWAFFGAMFCAAYFLVFVTIILAVLCYLNFGIGLPHYFERRNGEDGDEDLKYNEDFHPTPDTMTDPEKVSFPSPRSSVVAFPGGGPINTYNEFPKRSDSVNSGSSVGSRGSSRLPPMQIDRPTPRILIPATAMVADRNLTAYPSSVSSADKPSWKVGDDRHLMVARSDSTSSFGNLSSGHLDREISLSKSDIRRFGDIERSNTSSSTSSTSHARSNSSNSTLASSSLQGTRRQRVDLGAEL